MKSLFRKSAALLLSVLLGASVLAGCKNTNAPENTGAVTTADNFHDYETSGDVSVSTGKAVTFIKDGASQCRITWGSRVKDGSPIITEARKLVTYITSSTGVTLEARADYLMNGEDPTQLTEILIGETQREETAIVAESLRINDYAIQVVNNKLVVLGGCEAKTLEAVNKLVELYFSADRADLVLESGYRYQFRYDYSFTELTLDGNDILDYTIVYGEGSKGAATYLQKALTEAIGRELPVAEASADAAEHEILVGETGRNGSVKADEGSYKIGMENGNLIFSGDVGAVTLGVRDFVAAYITGENKDSKIAADIALSGKPSFGASVKLLDLNVTLSGYAENAVVNRYPRLYQMVSEQAPDVLCLQEVSCTTWLECIKNGIGETPALTEKYEFVGTGRNGEKPRGYDAFLEGAYNAILFDKTKYKLEDSGTFWLSETPDAVSVGWDARTLSICTWVKLTDNATGRQFVVMNTQLDSYGKNAAYNGAQLICTRAAEFDVPVIIAGDFACSSNGKAYLAVKNDSFDDSVTIADTVVSKGATENGYGSSNLNTATSHVFVSRGLCGVKSYQLLTDLVEGGYVSAHWAILTEIEY